MKNQKVNFKIIAIVIAIFIIIILGVILYKNKTKTKQERGEREHEIYLEYPEYYEDERILEEEEKWLEEFLNQLPEKKREYFEKLIKES